MIGKSRHLPASSSFLLFLRPTGVIVFNQRKSTMSSDHCRLLDLTPEILVLIAGYCDAWSLLRFGKTCRTIRSLCDDVVISQAAVEHCVSRPPAVARIVSLTSAAGRMAWV